MNTETMILRPTPSFGAEVLRHLATQLDSARRLLNTVLSQGAAIRERDTDRVLKRLADLQAEMERRGTLERERAQVLHTAAAGLGIAAHEVTLEALTALLSAQEAEQARAASAELRGVLAEVQREHQINRALMRQELAFLSHLTRMLGVDGEDVGYRPPTTPGGSMRATLDPAAAEHRMRSMLDLAA